MAETIFVGGLQKQSFLDYPGEVSCVVFLSGCNMRCHYCHNSQLFDSAENKMPFADVTEYIRKNKKMLGAVVISGGEPTVHPHLTDIIRQIRTINPDIKIKLDTNGTNPKVVKYLVNEKLIDFAAVDIKAPWHKYGEVAGFRGDIKGIIETVEFLNGGANIDHMFRTTLSPFLSARDIKEMGIELSADGQNPVKCWQIQQFNPNEFSNSFDTVLLPYPPEKVRIFAEIAEQYAQSVVVRGL